EGCYRTRFLGFLVHHHRHAHSTVGVASAAQLTPGGLRSVNQIAPVGESRDEGNREPVACRLAETGLILHVVRQVRERITLCCATFVGYRLIAAGKGDRLEREERNLLRVVQRELDDAAYLLVVDAVDDRDYRNDVHAVGVQVLNGPKLYI